MHYEVIDGLEVTYGNALAVGGGFHRVTTADGAAAEVSPHTFLWYKLSSPSPSAGTLSSASAAAAATASTLAITHLRVGHEHNPMDSGWIKVDKSIDRPNGRFVWYQTTQFKATTVAGSSSALTKPLMPLKEIRVVRDLKDVPHGFEVLDEPLVSVDEQESE